MEVCEGGGIGIETGIGVGIGIEVIYDGHTLTLFTVGKAGIQQTDSGFARLRTTRTYSSI
jgi:hypothetical protein